MHRPDGLVAVGNALTQCLDELAVQFRNRVPHSVGHVDRGGTLGNDRFEHTAQKIRIAAVPVFRAELDVCHQIARKSHRLTRLLQHLLRCHAQLLFHVQRRRGDERMDAPVVGALQGLGCARNVTVIGTRQRADGGLPDGIGDGLYRLEVADGTGGKTRLDDVHPQALELPRNTQLFIFRHGGAGRLLAITQSGIKNDQFIGHAVSPGTGGWALAP